ncbi:MAG: hypothetical protein EHM28_06710 [Spirochaetaceae bacterium]|nr:MAG: hypothetical protein EHM28_06710 [Spirochaetaceae bacterium]
MPDINYENTKKDFADLSTVPALQQATQTLTAALAAPVLAAPEIEPAWAERCFDCLKVRVPEGIWGLGPVKPWWDLYRAALNLLVRLRPAGVAKRLIELIDGSPGKVIKDLMQGIRDGDGDIIAWPERGASVIPTGEIGVILDWYEKLSAREAGPILGQQIRAMIMANGDAETAADLAQRLTNPKLKKPKQAALEIALKDLNELLAKEK